MLNITFTHIDIWAKLQWTTQAGYIIKSADLAMARIMIREVLQNHPLDFPEISWDGTRFRILPDE